MHAGEAPLAWKKIIKMLAMGTNSYLTILSPSFPRILSVSTSFSVRASSASRNLWSKSRFAITMSHICRLFISWKGKSFLSLHNRGDGRQLVSSFSVSMLGCLQQLWCKHYFWKRESRARENLQSLSRDHTYTVTVSTRYEFWRILSCSELVLSQHQLIAIPMQ